MVQHYSLHEEHVLSTDDKRVYTRELLLSIRRRVSHFLLYEATPWNSSGCSTKPRWLRHRGIRGGRRKTRKIQIVVNTARIQTEGFPRRGRLTRLAVALFLSTLKQARILRTSVVYRMDNSAHTQS